MQHILSVSGSDNHLNGFKAMRFYRVHLGIHRRNESNRETFWDTVLCFAVSSELTVQSRISSMQGKLVI